MSRRRKSISRRGFIGKAALFAGAVTSSKRIFSAGEKKIRIAMVGCGDRGTHDAITCLRAVQGVELYAMADLFRDRVESSLARLKRYAGAKVNVDKGRIFLGFDAYKKILSMDEIDMVMFLTPPGFRPEHVSEAVKAGKHMFLEKPGAVDPVGCRILLRSSEEADKKKLSIVVGTQQRYAPQYHEVINRIWGGQIGEIRTLKAYWICGMVNWHFHRRKPEWSDMEWQIRCWPYFVWLSGDHFVEQLCHNIDVCNWIMESTPEECMGLGGRQVRTAPEYGNIYDHFAVEYWYKDKRSGKMSMLAMAAQMANVSNNVSNVVEGTKGIAYVTRGGAWIEGKAPWRYPGRPPSGEAEMFRTLVGSIRKGEPVNECKRLAETTLTAVMGRMSTYTGKRLTYKWVLEKSKLDLRPPKYEFGPLPVRPVAMPGRTALI